MVARPDAVLALIPTLAGSGVALSWLVPVVESAVGVGGSLAAVPFTFLGLVGAMAVIGLEVLVAPFGDGD